MTFFLQTVQSLQYSDTVSKPILLIGTDCAVFVFSPQKRQITLAIL